MKPLLLALAVAAALVPSATKPDSPAPAAISALDPERTIFYAVLEGLYEDGVRTDMVDRMLLLDPGGHYAHFVPGCPLCIYAQEALRVYARRPAMTSWKTAPDTFGPGLSKEVRARLSSEDGTVRLDAVNELLQRWIAKRRDALRLTPAERAEWDRTMEEGRKLGMSILFGMRDAGQAGSSLKDSKGCAACDAANDQRWW